MVFKSQAFLLIIFSLIAFSIALAQEQRPSALSPQVIGELKQLQQAALASDYAFEQVAHLTDNIGARPSGSPQYDQAAEYVAAQLRQLGLEVTLEKAKVPHWVRGEETAALVQFPGMVPGRTQKIVLTTLGGSVATPPAGITADVVVVNSFDELKALSRDQVAGRIVVFNEKFDRHMATAGYALDAYGEAVGYRGGAPSAAARMGAVASLIRSVGGAEFRLPHTGVTHYAQDAPRIPAGALAAEDADLIARLARQGTVRMRLVLTPRQLPDAVQYNVIGDLKGTEHPEQMVIVSGHLDSWDLGTGALDDAAGVGVAMEVAQLVKKLGLRPRRTIRVIAWANEENGLRGGLTYSFEHKVDAANHYAAIETDLGAGHPLGFYLSGDHSVVKLLEPVADVLQLQGAGVLRETDETGADLIPLGVLGVPNFAPIQDARTYFDYHHTAADTLDKIVPQELRENVAAVAVLTYALANLEQPLSHVGQPVPEWVKDAEKDFAEKK